MAPGALTLTNYPYYQLAIQPAWKPEGTPFAGMQRHLGRGGSAATTACTPNLAPAGHREQAPTTEWCERGLFLCYPKVVFISSSTPAAQAAVLTLTEEDVSHLDGRELTKHKAERPTGTTCMLLRSFPLSLRAVFCLLSDFLVFSL